MLFLFPDKGMDVVLNNNPDLSSLLDEMNLDENNIITIEETPDDLEASNSSRGSRGSQMREGRDRRGRDGRRIRVKPRRSRHLEGEGPVSPRQHVPLKNAVMMLNEMYPPPGSLSLFLAVSPSSV